MRLVTRLLALCAVLLPLAAARADQTYTTAPIIFRADNQSLWLQNNGFSFDIPMMINWDYPFNVGVREKVDVLGTFSIGMEGRTKGRAGVILSQYAEGGSMVIRYPVTVTMNCPDTANLAPGQTFVLNTSWSPSPDAFGNEPELFIGRAPHIGLAAEGVFDLDQARLNFSARAFGAWIFRGDLFNFSCDLRQHLFDTDDIRFDSVSLYGGSLSIQRTVPQLNGVTMLEDGETVLKSERGGDFITVNANFSNIFALALGLPPFADGINETESEAGVTARVRGEYAFLSLYAQLPYFVRHTVQFAPRPKLFLQLSTGSTVVIYAGESVQLTMPADGSPLTITPRMTFDNELNSKFEVGVGGENAGVFFEPFSVHASLRVSGGGYGFSLDALDFSLGTYPVPVIIPGLPPIIPGVGEPLEFTTTLYNESWPINFADQTLPAFVITSTVTQPPQPPVAPNYFIPTVFDSRGCWVAYGALDVLSVNPNARIRITTQLEGTEDDFSTGWFRLNELGGYSFAQRGTPSSNGTVTKHYTIRDLDTGLESTGTITFRIGSGA